MLGSGVSLKTCSQDLLRSVSSARAFFQQNRQLRLTSMASASVLPDDIPNNTQPLNVLGTPLERHSVSPMTGYFRLVHLLISVLSDYPSQKLAETATAAVVDPSDAGEHTIAGVVSDLFLEFSASRGNNLSTPHPPVFPGLTSGCRWCLCASRWKEALLAYRAGDISRDAVPKVVLNATDSSSLRTVSLNDLRQFSFDDSRGER
ncbi:unnamed protein product [Rhizoctonia solani]|uniref:Uncharacterized protein n=1 Tax=Rhizoctonia solani TaxID=456999 RepID=A0A8H3D5Q3_9AGAM|nr:unnamed protein product [Rhizoctonia solani]